MSHTLMDRIFKRDCNGHLPRWWQWFFPRYGNWGGPGWSAKCWNPSPTRWHISAICPMDELFKDHDFAYQHGHDRDVADHNLVADLDAIEVDGFYAQCYRIGAMLCFTVWPYIRFF